MASVEIKTKVAANTLSSTLHLARSDPIFCHIGDDVCHRFIPMEHLVQVVQQATVIGASFAVCLVASETGVLYSVVVRVTSNVRSLCKSSLQRVADDIVG